MSPDLLAVGSDGIAERDTVFCMMIGSVIGDSCCPLAPCWFLRAPLPLFSSEISEYRKDIFVENTFCKIVLSKNSS